MSLYLVFCFLVGKEFKAVRHGCITSIKDITVNIDLCYCQSLRLETGELHLSSVRGKEILPAYIVR